MPEASDCSGLKIEFIHLNYVKTLNPKLETLNKLKIPELSFVYRPILCFGFGAFGFIWNLGFWI